MAECLQLRKERDCIERNLSASKMCGPCRAYATHWTVSEVLTALQAVPRAKRDNPVCFVTEDGDELTESLLTVDSTEDFEQVNFVFQTPRILTRKARKGRR